MQSQFIFLLILCSICGHTVDSANWDYGRHGPNVWSEISAEYAECAGKRQSPINIQTACTPHKEFQPFNFTSVHNEPINFTLKNNGHTITAETSDAVLLLTGGNLNGTYSFVSFHLHWGPNYNTGSEHQVNGDKAAGESHFIYKHDTSNQLAVLSFLMESRKDASHQEDLIDPMRDIAIENEWQKYFTVAQNLTQENDSTRINLILSSLMGSDLEKFWRYDGSLSTPPCTENVIWTVFKQRIYILNYQFEAFRDDLFFVSYRGPQPLYKRSVFRSFPEKIDPLIPDQECCSNKGSNIRLFVVDTNNIFFCLFFFAFSYFFY